MGLFDLIFQSIRLKVSFPRIAFYDERNSLFLDLAYITDNVIVMSLPALSFPKKIYRNNLKDVLRFLEQRHSGHWAIFEFCKEGTGYTDKDFLFKVFHYPFPDHQPPPFRVILEIIDFLSKYIQNSESNVAVLHCKAGKGRSGMIACCYLVSEDNLTVNSALSRFTQARIQKGHGDGVTILSQKRYVSYVEKWVVMGRKYQELDVAILWLKILGVNKKIGCKIYGYKNDNTIECLYEFLSPEMVNNTEMVYTPTVKLVYRLRDSIIVLDMMPDLLSLTLATDDMYNGDFPGITKSMVEEEATMIQSSIDEVRKQRESMETGIVIDDKNIARLKFLLEKSKIYASILSEKLQKQQVLRNEVQKMLKCSEKKIDQISIRLSDFNLLNCSVTYKKQEENIVKFTKKNSLAKNKKIVDKSKSTCGNYSITDYFTKKEIDNIVLAKPVTEVLYETKMKNSKSGNDSNVNSFGISPVFISQPKLVTGCVLRDYQLVGVEWLASLYENGLNGILADEMGLGKTLQTISFLAFLREKGTYGPFLIATPLSTISNWISEFTPEIPVLLYHGSKQERSDLRKNKMGTIHPDFPVIVTSYEIVMNDRQYLKRYQWKYIVVDEGHRIKNLNCRLIRELKGYDSANRLLLTGTPLQNNLTELWSLLNFLLPDIFDDLDSFQSWFDFSVFQDKNKDILFYDMDIISTLHCILKPFLLRRLKTDVEYSVSKKREYVLYIPMTVYQNELYNAILNENIQNKSIQKNFSGFTDNLSLNSDGEDSSIQNCYPSKYVKVGRLVPRRTRSKISYCELRDDECFDRLDRFVSRKNVIKHEPLHKQKYDFPTHPNTNEFLIDENIVNMSGKMLLLKRLLVALFEDDHKVLVFSQFSKMLDIIELWAVDIQKWKICRIDGLTKRNERKEQIERFYKDPDIKLFLLSTRAGGLGINLTAADTVIIFDSDWNPQQDLQAQDRVHRIGQTKVIVSEDTIENKILEKANEKRRLEELVIRKDKFKSFISISSPKDNIELSSMLLSEDPKKIVLKGGNNEILSNEDLESLLDRSDEAYLGLEKKRFYV
ncbi:hypothetical protein PMAC_001132 [Pneumocystis sp. 'macacae']|nr:hypothetical protein PMAC_001132 [Pneumocystis sp. 'macacae']